MLDESGKRKWIYPRKPSGRLYRWRLVVSALCLALLFGLPLLQINGEPAMLFDILNGRFIIMGQVFLPQDFFVFGLAMLCLIVFVVLFTVAFGRLWCGWACPQTVFMEMVFRRIEYWIEGDAQQQRALNHAPWNTEKIRKKTLKHVVFFVVSFLIANTFLAYFIGVKELFRIISEPPMEHIGGLAILLIFTAVFYAVFAFMREQICIVACPYGRLQGVLLDRNSIVVAYDYERGEPRGKLKKGEAAQEVGDCIDCKACVHVCPTGIDIRNGTQLECINCTACIDACDSIMDKIGKPHGLVTFASENSISSRKKLVFFTPRIIGYCVVLVALLGVLGFSIAGRSTMDVSILRARGTMFQQPEPGQISNLYTFKIMNKTRDSLPVSFRLEGGQGTIQIIAMKDSMLRPLGELNGQMFIRLPESAIQKRKTELVIGIYSNNKQLKTVKTTFLGPG